MFAFLPVQKRHSRLATGIFFGTCTGLGKCTGIVFGTCGAVFGTPQVSFLHHSYVTNTLASQSPLVGVLLWA